MKVSRVESVSSCWQINRTKNNAMFSLALVISLATGYSTAVFGADESTNIYGESVVLSNRKLADPIPFEPFKMLDPKTGAPLFESDLIEGPLGTKMKAGDYYRTLNGYQEALAKDGKSLKSADPGIVGTTIYSLDALNRASRSAKEEADEHDELVLGDILNYEKMAAMASASLKNTVHQELVSLYQKAINTGVIEDKVHSPVPPLEIQVGRKDDFFNILHKEWLFSFVGKDSDPNAPEGEDSKKSKKDSSPFGLDGKASIFARINLESLVAGMEAEMKGFAFGKDFSVFKAGAHGYRRINEISGGDLVLTIAKKDIFKRQWDIDTSSSFKISPKDSNRTVSMRESQEVRFSVGPIPMSGEAGVAGIASFDVAAGIQGMRAGIAAQGYAKAAGYAEVGPDVEIIEAGVSADLNVVDAVLTTGATMGLGIEEASKETVIDVSVAGKLSLTALSGSFGAYAEAFVPTLGIPPFEKRRWTFNIFEWDGFHLGGAKQISLWDFKKIVNRTGFHLVGAPKARDYDGVNIDEEIKKSFEQSRKIIEDESTTTVRALNESSTKLKVVQKEMDELIESMKI